MKTLDQDAIEAGYPNYATYLYKQRVKAQREAREADARANAEHQRESQQRRTAGQLPSAHTFTVVGGDPEAARAARMERAVNWGQPAEKAESGGTGG